MKNKTTGASTLIVMSGTAISRILGFLRIAVISTIFGGGHVADVLTTVFMIPNNLRKLLAEGALSTAFVPVFTKTISGNNEKKSAEKFVGSVISFQTWILVPLIAVCFIAAGPLSQILFPFKNVLVDAGFGAAGTNFINKASLSKELFPWMMQYLIFVSYSAIFMAVLNVHNKFTLTSLAPLMFSLSVITVLIALNKELFVWAQVLGVLLGGILQLSILYLGYRSLGYKVRFQIAFWRHPEFKALLQLLLPVLGSSIIFTLTELLAVSFATLMPTGSPSAISNSLVFWQLPYGIFSASISTVLYPIITKLVNEKKHDELANTVAYGLRSIILLLIPSTIMLLCFGLPIVSGALQSGKFTLENSYLTSQVLIVYALGMLPMGAVALLQRYFFASGYRAIPFTATIIIAVTDIVISIFIVILNYGPMGLAFANTISSLVGAGWMLVKTKQTLKYKISFNLFRTFIISLLASGSFLLFRFLSNFFFDTWWITGRSIKTLTILSINLVLAALVTFLVYKLFKVDEIINIFRRKKDA